MRKVLISSLFLTLCGIILPQTAKNVDYPNTEPFMRFWQKLRDYSSNGKVNLDKNYDLRIKGKFSDKRISEGDLNFEISENSPEMRELLNDFLLATDESKLLKIIALETLGEKIVAADLRIKFDEVNADFKLSMQANSAQNAQKITSRFSFLLGITARFVTGNFEEEFYKNASVTSENNEVFVNGKISRQNLINYIRFGFMSEETRVQNDCQIIREVQTPLTKKQNIKTEAKIVLLNTCLDDKIPQQRPVIEVVRAGKKEFREFEIIRVFANKAEAEKYAQENGITDVEFAKDTKNLAIRKIIPAAKRDIGDVKLEKFVLYEIGESFTEDIFVVEKGVTKSVKAKLINTFINGQEARNYAQEKNIADTPFAELADCEIIRIVEMPMTSLPKGSRPEIKTKPEITLLTTCVMKEKEWEELPRIKLMRDGKEVWRDYWGIRVFKDRAEALEYAEANGLSDVEINP